ncbi:hypothetical protein AB0B50_13555 [Streptomyces sp. NPDC041068]|uniref:hypothetical protein n=1 Tax=Streptomyces sp. NPDC041068 TaxID=3155130 RepID=UPI0033CF2A55
MRKWRSAVVTAAWVAVGTAAGALGAWQLASSDSAGESAHSRPLDEAAVQRALASARAGDGDSGGGGGGGGDSAGASGGASGVGASSPSAKPSRTPSSTPTAERSTVRFTGGSATVECRADGTVYLVSWSPADGFHIDDDVERGPAAVVRLEAEPGDDDEQEDLPYEIRCTADGPRAEVVPDTDDD